MSKWKCFPASKCQNTSKIRDYTKRLLLPWLTQFNRSQTCGDQLFRLLRKRDKERKIPLIFHPGPRGTLQTQWKKALLPLWHEIGAFTAIKPQRQTVNACTGRFGQVEGQRDAAKVETQLSDSLLDASSVAQECLDVKYRCVCFENSFGCVSPAAANTSGTHDSGHVVFTCTQLMQEPFWFWPAARRDFAESV